MKERMRYAVWTVTLLVIGGILSGCAHSQQATGGDDGSHALSSGVWIVSQPTLIEGQKMVDRQVLVMPGGYFHGGASAKVVFTKPVLVLSRTKVFDLGLEVEWSPGVFSALDIAWWGADGMDEEDDTEAIQRVLDLAARAGSMQVDIPIGRFYISSQIRMTGRPDYHQSLVIKGFATSYDGQHGSSLIWRGELGGSMILIANTSQTIFENLDFHVEPGKRLATNLEFRPSCNQISFRNCYFSGCTGEESCNVNLNEGNNLQVSELIFDNCIFKGVLTSKDFTRNAIRGGWANTKNFYFSHCSFGPYRNEAINIRTSDVLKVEACTFYLNDVDISCETCKTIAWGNYSEESGAFFASSASANFNSTTLVNNQFTGKPVDGFVIRDGSGTLILMNNNFGAGNYLPDRNMVRWEENDFNSIYSVGNVYKHASPDNPPFYNRSNRPYRKDRLMSFGDLGGVLGDGRVRLQDSRND